MERRGYSGTSYISYLLIGIRLSINNVPCNCLVMLRVLYIIASSKSYIQVYEVDQTEEG